MKRYAHIFKRMLAASVGSLLLLTGLPMVAGAAAAEATADTVGGDAYFTVGRIQPKGSLSTTSLALDGQARIDLEAAVPVDIRDYAAADLAVQMEMRITRHDGVTGPNSLKYVVNGRLEVLDSAGTRVLQTGSPVQTGIPAEERIAGEWMTVTLSMGAMTANNGKIAGITLFDYNDIPKKAEADGGAQTGITMEVKNARVVDTSRDETGTPLVKYELGAFNAAEGLFTPKASTNQVYINWNQANTAPINVSDDRSRYALTMDFDFFSEDEAVDPATSWKNITVKLRSSDKTVEGVEGTEHNYGWNITPSQYADPAHLSVMITLDKAANHTRGTIDWADIQRLICYVDFNASATAAIQMQVSNVRIIDLEAVDGVRESLQTLIDTEQNQADFTEAGWAAYTAAKEAAQQVCDDASALPNAINKASAALKATLPATDEQIAELRKYLSKEVDSTLYTAASYAAYEKITGEIATMLLSPVTRGEATKAITAVENAWYGLEFDDSPVESVGNLGDVDGENGVAAADALLALQAATNKITLSPAQIKAANVDGKGDITANDALLILQYATKKITTFPGKEDLSTMTVAVENKNPTTTANPVDLSYMFQRAYNDANRPNGQASYRESADPAIVVFKDKYYLFASHGGGYWSSTDLADWTFIQVDMPTAEEDPNFKELYSQFRKYAPATCVVGDTLYLTHSEGGDILKSTNPDDPDSWEFVRKCHGWMDPGMFYDDPATGGDGYVYLYKGLSHRDAIQVIKMDPNDNMALVDGPYDCAWPDRENRGFEVRGDNNNRYTEYTTMEGAWPIKYNGKYYITCAVPDTAVASYSNNCFVSDSPMGPFTYCENSPVSWKSTGFTQGAGHGGFFEDLNGNWWAIQTCRIAGFERRLVLLPATFGEDGNLYTNAVQGDYPMYIPTQNEDPFNNPGPNWGQLAYNKSATASSNAGSANLAFNEDMRNAWVAATGDAGEWLQVDLGRVYGVWSVQVNFADKSFTGLGGRGNGYAFRYLMEFSQDGETWYTMVDRQNQTEDLTNEYIEFENKVGARYIRITNKGEIPAGGLFAIHGLRVFGEGGGRTPAKVDASSISYDRRADNNRTMGISWEKTPGAQGYIIRYGVQPDKLHHMFQVMDNQSVVINTLTRGLDYYFTIDAYNESGVTPGTDIIKVEATEGLVPGYDVDNDNPALVNREEGYVVHEAEKAAITGEGITTQYEVRASDAYALHGFGAADSSLTFTGVEAGKDTTATLRLSYALLRTKEQSESVTVGIKVNDTDHTLSLKKTTGWATFATADIKISGLVEGAENTVIITGMGETVHLDWMQVIYEKEPEKPGVLEDPIEGLVDPAQSEKYKVYEAEAAAIEVANIANDTAASGGQSVHSMEKEGASVTFTKVDGGMGGEGRLRLAYSCGNGAGGFKLTVNGTVVTTESLPNTGAWGTFKMLEFPVDNLTAGRTNTVVLECGGAGYNPDWIQLICTIDPNAPEEDTSAEPFDGLAEPKQATGYTVYEAEAAEIGVASVADDSKASGGKSVHSMEKEGAYVEFKNVDGGTGGKARLRLSYCEGNMAGKLVLIVNGQTVVETDLKNTGTWSDFKMIEFALEEVLAGETNTVRLECGGNGYNPDWIQLIYDKAE